MSYYLPSNLSTYQVPVTEKGLQKLFKSIGMLDSSKNVSGEDLWRVS